MQIYSPLEKIDDELAVTTGYSDKLANHQSRITEPSLRTSNLLKLDPLTNMV